MTFQSMRDVRFPREMLNGPANERLLRFLGVQIVDECDLELEEIARAWLATIPMRDGEVRNDAIPACEAVRDALDRIDAKRAA